MTTLKAAIQEMRERCEAADYPMSVCRVEETTAMGETWWNVVFADAPREFDERQVIGSFTKGRAHAEFFAGWMNSETRTPKLISALEVTLEALEEAKRWCELGSVELPPRGKPRLSEIMDEALSKAEQLLTGSAPSTAGAKE